MEGLAFQMINREDLEAENYIAPLNTKSQRRLQFLDRKKSTLKEEDTMECQKFEEVTQYEMPPNERVIYAGFLYDQNPTFVLIITVNEEENCSYLSLGKINSP